MLQLHVKGCPAYLLFVCIFLPNANTIHMIPGDGQDCYCISDRNEGPMAGQDTADPYLVACRVCFRQGQLFDQWNWDLARTKCQEKSLDLVVLTSQAITDRAVRIIKEANMSDTFDWNYAQGTREGPYIWTGAVSSQSGGDWLWTWLGGQQIKRLWHPPNAGMSGQSAEEDEELVLGVDKWINEKTEKIKPYIWGYMCGTPLPDVKSSANKDRRNQEKKGGGSSIAAIVGGVVGVCLFAIICLGITLVVIRWRRRSAVPKGEESEEIDEVYTDPEAYHSTSSPEEKSGWRAGTLPTLPVPGTDSKGAPAKPPTYDNAKEPGGTTYDNTKENMTSDDNHTYAEAF